MRARGAIRSTAFCLNSSSGEEQGDSSVTPGDSRTRTKVERTTGGRQKFMGATATRTGALAI
jgi:hypothetical protein